MPCKVFKNFNQVCDVAEHTGCSNTDPTKVNEIFNMNQLHLIENLGLILIHTCINFVFGATNFPRYINKNWAVSKVS